MNVHNSNSKSYKASMCGWAPHTDDDSLVYGLSVYALVIAISKRLVFVMCLILMCVGFIPSLSPINACLLQCSCSESVMSDCEIVDVYAHSYVCSFGS